MTNNYAVIQNSLVINIAIADAEFAQSQGWVACSDSVSIGWSYVNGKFIAPIPPAPTPEDIQAQNKATATQLLLDTDWTEFPSVTDTTKNPHLLNKSDFVNYRVKVRAIAVNPPITSAEFPDKPVEQWS